MGTLSSRVIEVRPERGPVSVDRGFSGDGALQAGTSVRSTLQIPATSANFEGLSNQDNFNIFGFRVNPPDTVGAVGPNHYVEMINRLCRTPRPAHCFDQSTRDAVDLFRRPGLHRIRPATRSCSTTNFPIAGC
jgi:hypothetical protein